MPILFLDESGSHSLTAIDPQYPLFVLGGVIVHKEYEAQELPNMMDDFKKRVFGSTEVILHTAEICRNKNQFACLKDPHFRSFFYQELNYLMKRLQYMVIACVIHKDNHLRCYGAAALDPYFLSLDLLVERFISEIPALQKGLIIAEKRGGTLDKELELSWLNLQIQGAKHTSATKIKKAIQGLELRDKKENLAGLQLADLVVSPIGRHILGKPEREDFQIIKQKFRTNHNGEYQGHGLVILPY